jgi:hypothetical protein
MSESAFPDSGQVELGIPCVIGGAAYPAGRNPFPPRRGANTPRGA